MIKVNEIDKMTQIGNYQINIDLTYLNDHLDHYKESYGLDLNPDFQRGHVWSTEQRSKFMEYLIRGGKLFQPIIFNSPSFAGLNKSKESDLSDDIVIVDGLQRLTTCLMFIDNKISVFNGNYPSDFDDPKLLLRKICLTIAVNALQTRKELLQFYLELNEGHIAHSSEELDRVKELLNNIK
jgi:hypothetical protein